MAFVNERALAILVVAALAGACTRPPAPAAAPPAEARASAESFINKVWRVRTSSGVEPGALYVFLSDGTLVMTSKHATPAFGAWKYEDGVMTMIEEGLPYKIEILALTRDEFTIRSHNPGEPVDITFELADDVPMPAAK